MRVVVWSSVVYEGGDGMPAITYVACIFCVGQAMHTEISGHAMT